MHRTVLSAAALMLAASVAPAISQTPPPAATASPAASATPAAPATPAVPLPVVTFLNEDSPAPRVPSPSPSPEPSPTPAPEHTPYATPPPVHDLPIDGAYTLPGIWDCETLANSKARSVYRLTDKEHMEERTTLHLPKRPPIELDTEFTYDAPSDRWHLSMQNGAYRATSRPWSNTVWRFQGFEYDAEPHRLVRLVYTSLGPDSYRSDFEALNKGVWQTFSGATCKRYVP